MGLRKLCRLSRTLLLSKRHSGTFRVPSGSLLPEQILVPLAVQRWEVQPDLLGKEG